MDFSGSEPLRLSDSRRPLERTFNSYVAWTFREEEIVGGDTFYESFHEKRLERLARLRETEPPRVDYAYFCRELSHYVNARSRSRRARRGLHYRLTTYFCLRCYAHVGKLEGTVGGDQGEPLRVGRAWYQDGWSTKISPSPLYCQIVRVSVQVLGSARLIYHELFFIRANATEADRSTSHSWHEYTAPESPRLVRQRAEGGISRNANLIEFPLAAGGKAEGQKNKISRDSTRSPLVVSTKSRRQHCPRASVGFAPSET